MNIIDEIDNKSRKEGIPDFRPGDTLNVNVKVVEGDKTRIQTFKGFVVGRSGSGIHETFTVRKVSGGVGVERTFPVHSPSIDSIELVSHGDVRRAKLYYMRGLSGKKARIKEKRVLDKPTDNSKSSK